MSLMQRMDIPLIVLLAVFYKEKRPLFQNILSVATIVVTCLFVYFQVITEEHEHTLNKSDWDGFMLICFAALLLAINSRLVKKSVAEDNAFVITNITCISTSVMGFFISLFKGDSFYIQPLDCGWILVLTTFLILSYYYLVEIYKLYSPEKAQFTGVLAILATMTFEMLFEKRIFPTGQILAVCCIAFMTYMVSTNGKLLRILSSKKIS